MSDKPIIFSPPMVRALLDGSKTQTRRVLKPQPDFRGGCGDYHDAEAWGWADECGSHVSVLDICPNGMRKGDRLWVREHWRCAARWDDTAPRDLTPRGTTIFYECGGSASTEIPAGITINGVNYGPETGEKWIVEKAPVAGLLPPYAGRFRQGMHMPRWASRITLLVTEVRVQRLQEISEADAVAEGGDPVQARMYPELGTCRHWFSDLWNSINGPDAWDANPWVAAYTFTVQRGNIDQFEAPHA